MRSGTLSVRDLTVSYGSSVRPALHSVDLQVKPNSVHALIGGSGSGKTTLGKAVAGLVPVVTGEISLHAEPGAGSPPPGSIQMVFQDPFSSLDPRYRVGEIVREAVAMDPETTPSDRGGRVEELISLVALARGLIDRFPHQLSGGECQRVAIARAIGSRPVVLIADEITSSLDVTVQARIIDLLDELAGTLDLSILLITHDLAIADRLADDMTVLERGLVVERGIDALADPQHPYTRLLVDSLLVI